MFRKGWNNDVQIKISNWKSRSIYSHHCTNSITFCLYQLFLTQGRRIVWVLYCQLANLNSIITKDWFEIILKLFLWKRSHRRTLIELPKSLQLFLKPCNPFLLGISMFKSTKNRFVKFEIYLQKFKYESLNNYILCKYNFMSSSQYLLQLIIKNRWCREVFAYYFNAKN